MAVKVQPKRFRWRCACGKHPYPSRTRWLRRKRPRILCWGRHGKAGGCRILLDQLPVTGAPGGRRAPRWLATAKRCTLKTPYRTDNWKKASRYQTSEKNNNESREAESASPEKGKNVVTLYNKQGQAKKAQGGCLGTKGRRKTRQAAKSCGEGHMPVDPQVSEWGNPHGAHPVYPCVNP